jgi:hypothetical protein
MDRRRFLVASLAGAIAGPLAAEGQAGKVYRVGFLGSQRNRIEIAAQTLGVRLQFREARSPAEIDAAFAAMASERPHALLAMADPCLTVSASGSWD